MGKNGEFSNPGNTTPPVSENTTKPLSTDTYEEIINEKKNEKFPTENFSENREFPTINPPGQSYPSGNAAAYYATLPPAQRPSPFRDGNTLWVNNINDVDERLNSLGEPWGERKMGDIIRYYPGMDPYEKQNRAA